MRRPRTRSRCRNVAVVSELAPAASPYHPTPRVQAFDDWIRSRFVDLNSELEDLYERRSDRTAVATVGESQKRRLVTEGGVLIDALIDEGNTDEGFDRAYELLGSVGYFLAACRRHEIEHPHGQELAMQIGAFVGTVPRFVASHMETYNRAINGRYRTFTWRTAETTFLDANTRATFAHMRAAEAVRQIRPLGVSHPVVFDLLDTAATALGEALVVVQRLADELDVDDFFHCVRPYYKPYEVGGRTYRGANAGDFAAFNQLDLILGLCRPTDRAYAQVVLEKLPYLTPDEQVRLRDAFRHPNLIDAFLAEQGHADEAWFGRHVGRFLDVCEAYAAVATFHHDVLVERFIVDPSASLPAARLEDLTASGPPLPVLLRSLRRLRDLRAGVERADGLPSRAAELDRLRRLAGRR